MKKQKTKVKQVKRVIKNRAKKKVEYMPITSKKQVIVRFTMAQLNDIVNQLRKSHAQEIGVPIKPYKV